MTPCFRKVELLDHRMRLRKNEVQRFPRLEIRLLCSEEYVDSSVMVAYCIVVGWWLDIWKNVNEIDIQRSVEKNNAM